MKGRSPICRNRKERHTAGAMHVIEQRIAAERNERETNAKEFLAARALHDGAIFDLEPQIFHADVLRKLIEDAIKDGREVGSTLSSRLGRGASRKQERGKNDNGSSTRHRANSILWIART